jgi:phosphoenolpyruvate phosphomutase
MHVNMPSALRELFTTRPLVLVAGAHNGISAKLVERNGFQAIWASSFEISTSHGVPDASILTMSELLEAARSMAEVVNIPIIADCDSGFGDAANVRYMAHKYGAAGIAAVCIEDKQFPKTNSFIDGRQKLVAPEEFAEKIQSAVRGRGDSGLMIFARTEALVANWGLDEALQRARAYREAGADVILVHSKARTPAEVLEFGQRWGKRTPVAIIPTTYYDISLDEVRRAGIQVVIFANHAMRSAVRAMDNTLARIVAMGSSKGVEGEIASMKELFDLQGMDELVTSCR